MSTPEVEAAWGALARHLEEVYDAWRLDDPQDRAWMIVRAMRSEGWRVPLPHGSRPPAPRGSGADPVFRSRMAAQAREAVRKSRGRNYQPVP